MTVLQWWRLRVSIWRLTRIRRRYRRALERKYGSLPEAKDIIMHIAMPRELQKDLMKEIKEEMWGKGEPSQRSKSTPSET